MLLNAFILKLCDGKDDVSSSFFYHEVTLAFRNHVCYISGDAVEQNGCQDFSGYVEEGYASVVITDSFITLELTCMLDDLAC